ncbi:MAG: hypothetical protein ACRDDJ_20015, partial [[Mycobacterium] stephanolepidis]
MFMHGLGISLRRQADGAAMHEPRQNGYTDEQTVGGVRPGLLWPIQPTRRSNVRHRISGPT